jgi:OPA family glycerol-3-phosphate transporter-like MFS transporter
MASPSVLPPPVHARAPSSPPVAPTHSRAFALRRAANWIPLGLTYATFYMGRYNFNVVKGDLGAVYHLDKTQVGAIATAGFWTYALSVIVNGPIADRFGGRRAILFGAAGTVLMNLAIGLLFLGGWATHLVLGMSLLYGVSMYAQSFGALSIVKINAAWFHVRERGVFGGIFGVMISSGYLLALTVGGQIYGASKKAFGPGALAFAPVFLVPAAAILVMFVVDWLRVRDTPKHAGFEDFHTGGHDDHVVEAPDARPPLLSVLGKILAHPVIRVITLAEFCTGFVRQGLLLYFLEFLKEVHHVEAGTPTQYWAGIGVTIGGIAGGLLCGWLSDKVFDSRRPPVAFLFYLGQIGSLIALGQVKSAGLAAFMVGFSCMFIFGVHGMLSGTASADFGGRKGAATAAGVLDGVQYVASGLTGFGLGWLLQHYHWRIWTWSLVPFALAGALLMLRIWNAKPSRGGAH